MQSQTVSIVGHVRTVASSSARLIVSLDSVHEFCRCRCYTKVHAIRMRVRPGELLIEVLISESGSKLVAKPCFNLLYHACEMKCIPT